MRTIVINTAMLAVVKKGKGFPQSLPSVGPGADPGVQAVSPAGSPGRRSETTGRRGGFVKQVGFKSGVKQRGSYGRAEW